MHSFSKNFHSILIPDPQWVNWGHGSVLEPIPLARGNGYTDWSVLRKTPTSDLRNVPSGIYAKSMRKVGSQRKLQGAKPKEREWGLEDSLAIPTVDHSTMLRCLDFILSRMGNHCSLVIRRESII